MNKIVQRINREIEVITRIERLRSRWGNTALSSYLTSSSSDMYFDSKIFGKMYSLIGINKKKGIGKNIPAIGIHVAQKHDNK
jgi:hypothetical protein